MTLEDLKKLFGEAIDKAHFIVASLEGNKKVEGVSLRLDSDGVMSVIFHMVHAQGRTETTESLHLKNALELYEYFDKTTAKDLEGAFVDWETLEDALDSYGYPEDPDEYDVKEIPDRIKALLKDRNALAKEIEALKKNLQTPKIKEEPKKNTKVKKDDVKPAALKSAEIDATRSKIFDYITREQPVSATKISKQLANSSFDISYDDMERILDHEWFEKTKSGWRIAIKEKI